MSSQSDGIAAHCDDAPIQLPTTAEEAANAAKRQLVSRKRDVELVTTKMAPVKDVFDAIVSSVNPQQIECIQQINARKFLLTFKTVGSAETFLRDSVPSMLIAGAAPTCRWLGSERKNVRVSFLPCAVPNSELSSILHKYGKVIQITDELYANSPFGIKTGTRIVLMEMTSPVPNIITVCGFTVPVTYRGVVSQCRRCLQPGHIKSECKATFCDRCKQFGHDSSLCKAPCLKCSSTDHHWRNCSVRSYAFVAASHAPELDTASTDTVVGTCDAAAAAEEFPNTEEPTVSLENLPVRSSSVASNDVKTEPPSNENTLEDASFGSATENNFEGSLNVSSNTERAVAESEEVNNASTPAAQATSTRTHATAAECNDGWQVPKTGRIKRKIPTRTPEKSPSSGETPGKRANLGLKLLQ